MAKISEETRLHFSEIILPYKDKINSILMKEKTMQNGMHPGDVDLEYKKLPLCDDMIYVASLYIAQNSLSLKIMEVKNNDALNDARKMLYKAIIYLEEIVTNVIDAAQSEMEDKLALISEAPIEKRFNLVRKLGLAISLLIDAFGDNTKWKMSFVELQGRFATVAKNLLDLKQACKDYFDPNSPNYDNSVLYVRLIRKLYDQSATAFRDKYELATHRIDDMRNAILFLSGARRIAIALGEAENAEEIKKKAGVWKQKVEADQKKGIAK